MWKVLDYQLSYIIAYLISSFISLLCEYIETDLLLPITRNYFGLDVTLNMVCNRQRSPDFK
jgi:hypothetical protein